jgi:hypothetical protein
MRTIGLLTRLTLAWSRESSGYKRRAIGVGLLAVIAVASVWQPLYGSPPKCSDLWRNGVCILV